ncbi:hypothetical protein [Arthrobacter sp. 260]|uniref:hypothetical protein n=1 Tax=Arthrobacter sp. 260 TaxID=2735314 RepID=UPI001490AA5B|nr:hypothetical protein [Arthrobacter sp. 260]NOJ59745.1 hypothetical protein [Arthrobacter sp. 260]
MSTQYRKTPVVIEAMLLNGNAHEVMTWVQQIPRGASATYDLDDNGPIYITTVEGTMKAEPGDYIIRGVQGEFYLCKPDIFEKTYEQVG